MSIGQTRRVFSEMGLKQTGITLMELLVAVAVGIIVTSAMVGLMANTLGAGTRTIEMSRLQQELRTSMQLMTRDLRRASYHAEAILCFGNDDCGTDGSLAGALAPDIVINGDNDCLYYQTDRGHDGHPTNDVRGGFRREVDGDGVGFITMWVTTATSDPDCSSTDNSDNDNWIPITDPDFVNVTELLICEWVDSSDAECDGVLPGGGTDTTFPDVLSYNQEIDNDGVNITWQRVRKVQIRMAATLINTSGDFDISKTLIDRIRIRNDLLFTTAVP